MHLKTSALVASLSLCAQACLATGQETADGALNPEGDAPTVVALYTTKDMPLQDGGTLRVVDAVGAGVLLCPDVVLTNIQSGRALAKLGHVQVSNRAAIYEPKEVVVRHRHWFDDHYTVREAQTEDAHLVPGVATELPVFQTKEYVDGFIAMQLDRPYGTDLPYPTLASQTSWSKGTVGTSYGYGLSSDVAPYYDAGVRRGGEARFTRYAKKDGVTGAVYSMLLTFNALVQGAVVRAGDGGGPTFGPVGADGRAPLVGIHVLTNMISHFFDLDVGVHADALAQIRDSMCTPAGAVRPATEIEEQAQNFAPPAAEGGMAIPGLQLAEGDTLCVCDEDCAIDCAIPSNL